MARVLLIGSALGLVFLSAFVHAGPVMPELGSTIDYPAFVGCFDGPSADAPVLCNRANFHPDSHVDLADFSIVQRDYTLTPGALQFATETAGQVHPTDDADEYFFEGVFGTTVTVDYVTPQVNNRPDLIVRLELVRPNGTVAATTASCGTPSAGSCRPTATWA